MGFFDSVIDGVMLSKAKQTVVVSEAARRARLKAVLFQMLGAELPPPDIDAILAATRQSDAVRGIASVAGQNMVGDILGKVANALDGR
jgi:hypothetical protein